MTDLSADVRALFDGPNYGHVATVLPNGGPHSVPVWVGLEGNRVAFLTDPASRKARNLAHDPRVAISITDRNQPFAMAQVRGRIAERLEGEAAWTIIDRISHKYTGRPYPLRTDRVVFLVEPEHAWAHAFG
jgi:PPOX class probable F420-dependent enzyme